MTKKITTIPATVLKYTQTTIGSSEKRKVAGYARVSTDMDDQLQSQAAQVDYYTNYIQSREDWEFVEVYTDEGITATSTKRREGFNRMIADALAGKIDLIITKSVSRFARNTVDSLSNIRKLKDAGVEVYFEKENIWTFDSKGELLITIMSSLAQEEARSISENCTWGQRKRFADGKVSVAYSRFLGYDKGPDGNLIINEEQAQIVKKIYKMFLQGFSAPRIARRLTEEKIPTPANKTKWCASTVLRILQNEKYKGDALLQKSFTVDYLTKKTKKNEGEVPQYYIKGNHEAIIDPDTFDRVQNLIKIRSSNKYAVQSDSIFAGRIKCGNCGANYIRNVWHSNEKYRKEVWKCLDYYKGEKCHTPVIEEAKIPSIFINVTNELLKQKKHLIDQHKKEMESIFDTSDLENKKLRLEMEINTLAGVINNMASFTTSSMSSATAFEEEYIAAVQNYNKTQERLKATENELFQKKNRYQELEYFIKQITPLTHIETFDKELWLNIIDRLVVYRERKIKAIFIDKTEITIDLD